MISPNYSGGYSPQIQKKLWIPLHTLRNKVEILCIKLNVEWDIFAAEITALDKGILSLEEIVGNELPKFEATIGLLSPKQKQLVSVYYEYAVTYGNVSSNAVIEYSGLKMDFGTINAVYTKLNISNRAQFALYAYIYMHLMRSPILEMLTRKQINALEAVIYNSPDYYNHIAQVLGIAASSVKITVNRVTKKLESNNIVEAICKAIKLGYNSLLKGVDKEALNSLDESEIDLLKQTARLPIKDIQPIRGMESVYEKLRVYNSAQLAPYVYFVVKQNL